MPQISNIKVGSTTYSLKDGNAARVYQHCIVEDFNASQSYVSGKVVKHDTGIYQLNSAYSGSGGWESVDATSVTLSDYLKLACEDYAKAMAAYKMMHEYSRIGVQYINVDKSKVWKETTFSNLDPNAYYNLLFQWRGTASTTKFQQRAIGSNTVYFPTNGQSTFGGSSIQTTGCTSVRPTADGNITAGFYSTGNTNLPARSINSSGSGAACLVTVWCFAADIADLDMTVALEQFGYEPLEESE